MAVQLKEFLNRIPPGTEALVEQTKRRFNQAVRQILRAETGLRLSNLVSGEKGEERETLAIKVFISAGMPEELEQLAFDDDFWLAIELAPLKGILESSRSSLTELSVPIAHLSKRSEFQTRFPRAIEVVSEMRGLTEQLLVEVSKFKLLEKIFAINRDVMGLYSYRSVTSPTLFNDDPPPKVQAELYWAVIGFIAKVLGVSIEGLTVKVLAHELAHAYTHIGADHDGQRWNSVGFSKTEVALKEGLAQYYTARVLDRLETQAPGAKDAYKKLLPHQPVAYRTHVPWLEEFSPEEVRLAMIETRRSGIGTVKKFEIALTEASERLRK